MRLLKKTKIRFLLMIYPSNIKLSGKCDMCGNCCRSLALTFGGKFIRSEKIFHFAQKFFPEYRYFKILYKENNGDLVFYCTKIGDNNKCTIYDERPIFCREYPTRSIIKYYGRFPENCGYKVTAIVDFKKMLEYKKTITKSDGQNSIKRF